jgi:hypothetical protein
VLDTVRAFFRGPFRVFFCEVFLELRDAALDEAARSERSEATERSGAEFSESFGVEVEEETVRAIAHPVSVRHAGRRKRTILRESRHRRG